MKMFLIFCLMLFGSLMAFATQPTDPVDHEFTELSASQDMKLMVGVDITNDYSIFRENEITYLGRASSFGDVSFAIDVDDLQETMSNDIYPLPVLMEAFNYLDPNYPYKQELIMNREDRYIKSINKYPNRDVGLFNRL